MKKFSYYIAFSILFLVLNARLSACHGLPLTGFSFSLSPTGLVVKASSDPATCGCGPYWLQVEVSCTPVFNSPMPACLTSTLVAWNNPGTSYTSYPYYNSLLNIPNYNLASGWFDNCVPESYHPVNVPFSHFCAGTTVYFRAREVVGGSGPTFGPWTPVNSFLVPGTITTTTSCSPTLVHTPPTTPATPMCPGGVLLTINNPTCNTWCGGTMAPSCNTPTVYYKWKSNPNTSVTPTITSVPSLSVPLVSTTTTFSVWAIDSCIGPCPPKSLCSSNPLWPLVTTVFVNNNVPPATIAASPNQCLNGNNFTFNSPGIPGTTYNWNFGDGATATGPVANHSYSAPGNYVVSLSATAPGSCGAGNTTHTVTVYPMPTLTAGNNGPLCEGQTLNLTSSGAITYTWSGPGFSSSLQNPTITGITISNSGIYQVTGTDANGCQATASTTVIINAAPALSITNSGPVCSGQTLTVSVSGGTTYNWTGPNSFTSTQNSIVLSNAAVSSSGVYTVTSATAGGCVSTATTNVIINPTPTLSIINSGQVCENQSITLTATGANSYSWTGPNSFSSVQPTVTLSNVTANDAGVYTVTGTSAEGCVATATTIVIVNPAPVMTVSNSSPLCSGEDLDLSTSYNDAGTFLWTGPNGFSSVQKDPRINSAQSAASGNYTLTVTSNKGCQASKVSLATVYPLPNVSVSGTNLKGCAPLCNVNLISSTTSNVKSYEWSINNGIHTSDPHLQNICFEYSGNYTASLTVTDMNNCKAELSKIIEVYPKPIADFNYSPNPINITNPLVDFKDLSFGGDIRDWNWTIYPSFTETFMVQNPTVTFKDTGTYNIFLVVTNTSGCKDTVHKPVYIYEDFMFYVPNAFTPNGDGQNDEFKPVITNVNTFSMIIYDRWGKEVFNTKDLNKGWDGSAKNKVNNNLSKQEVYVWRIEFTSNQGKKELHTGHVTLIK